MTVFSRSGVVHGDRRRGDAGSAALEHIAMMVVAALAVATVGTAVAGSREELSAAASGAICEVVSQCAVDAASTSDSGSVAGGGSGAAVTDGSGTVSSDGVPADAGAPGAVEVAVATSPGVAQPLLAPASTVVTALGEQVQRGVGVGDAVSFLNALLLEGLITPEQYAQFSADAAIMAGVQEALASGGTVAFDSPGQREMDRLLAASVDQLRQVLAQPVDLQVGPSGAQVLALYALAGGNDFAMLETTINWLLATVPDLELLYDGGVRNFLAGEEITWGEFYFARGGERVSSPFLDRLTRDLYTGDIATKELGLIFDNWRGFVRRPSAPHNSDSGEPAPARNSDDGSGASGGGRGARSNTGASAGPISVRPRFEHVNADRLADLGVGSSSRLDSIAAALGLRSENGAYVIPGAGGRARAGFDIDDNIEGGKTPGTDTLIVELLRMQDASLLSGSDYLSIADNAAVVGGLGDDFFLQIGGEMLIDGGAGNNEVVVAGGAATVVEGQGSTTVTTVESALLPGANVDLSLVDDGRPGGDLGVVLGADGTLSGSFTTAGNRSFTVLPGATVGVQGGLTSTADGGQETVVVAGTLTGGQDGSGVVDLGPGNDRVVTAPGSLLRDLDVRLGSGEDAVDLGGGVSGVIVDLGTKNDVVVVRDTVTGGVTLTDSKGAWRWAKDDADDVQENDTLILGEGFTAPEGVGSGIVRLGPDGTVVAEVTLGGDSTNVEQVVVVGADGTVTESLQTIPPEVKRQAGFLNFLSDVATIAGIVTGQPWLAAAGQVVGGVEQVVNGDDAFDVLVGTGTGVAGSLTGVGWLGPAGASAVALKNGSLESALPSLLTLAGAVDADLSGITAADSVFTRAGGVLSSVRAVDAALSTGDTLGVIGGAVGVADAATGSTDQQVFDQIRGGITVSQAAATGDIGGLAVGSARLLDSVGAFDSLQPAAPGTSATAARTPPDVNLNDLLLASVFFPDSTQPDLPLEVGQKRVYTTRDGTRWQVENYAEAGSGDEVGVAILNLQILDDKDRATPYLLDTDPVLTRQDGQSVLITSRVLRTSGGEDGSLPTSYTVERTYTDVSGDPVVDLAASLSDLDRFSTARAQDLDNAIQAGSAAVRGVLNTELPLDKLTFSDDVALTGAPVGIPIANLDALYADRNPTVGEAMSGLVDIAGSLFGAGRTVSIVTNTRDGLVIVDKVEQGDLQGALADAAIVAGGEVAGRTLDRVGAGVAQANQQPTLTFDSATGQARLIVPRADGTQTSAPVTLAPDGRGGVVIDAPDGTRRALTPEESLRVLGVPSSTAGVPGTAGTAPSGRGQPGTEGVSGTEAGGAGGSTNGNGGAGGTGNGGRGSATPDDDGSPPDDGNNGDVGDDPDSEAPGSGYRPAQPPPSSPPSERPNYQLGQEVPLGVLNPALSSTSLTTRILTGPTGDSSVTIKVKAGTSPAGVGLPATGYTGDSLAAGVRGEATVGGSRDGVSSEWTLYADTRTGTGGKQETKSVNTVIETFERADANAIEKAQAALTWLGSVSPSGSASVSVEVTVGVPSQVTQWLVSQRMVDSQGRIDIDALNQLATPPRSTHQIFSGIPTQTPLPVIDVDTLPVSRTGTVLLPSQLPVVDSASFDGSPRVPPANEFGAPSAWRLPPVEELPALPATNTSGQPIVVDFEGPTSGVLAVDPDTGGSVLLEVPDAVAGPPSLDSEGRRVVVDVRPRVELPERELVPVDDAPAVQPLPELRRLPEEGADEPRRE